MANNKCDFEHEEFNDHHDYILKDFEKVNSSLNILTTEKDYAKLTKILPKRKIYYLPIKVNIDSNKLFDKLIIDYCNN